LERAKNGFNLLVGWMQFMDLRSIIDENESEVCDQLEMHIKKPAFITKAGCF